MDFEGYPLLDFDSFNTRFEELMPIHPTYQEAFEAVEKEVEEKYNHRKYKSFESFMKSRNRTFGKRKRTRHWNDKFGQHQRRTWG